MNWLSMHIDLKRREAKDNVSLSHNKSSVRGRQLNREMFSRQNPAHDDNKREEWQSVKRMATLRKSDHGEWKSTNERIQRLLAVAHKAFNSVQVVNKSS